MAFCTNCGGRIEGDLKYCTNCGAPLEAVELPALETMLDMSEAANPTQQTQQQTYQQTYQQPSFDPQPAAQPQPEPAVSPQPTFAPGAETQAPPADTGNIGWGILGFFIPLVGLILFFVWRNTKPQTAKVALIGAVVGICLGILFRFMG